MNKAIIILRITLPSRAIPRVNKMIHPVHIPKCNSTPLMKPGDFTGHSEKKMLGNMYDAITELKLWDWLRTFSPKANEGFMWSPALEISQIGNHPKVDADGHTGATFAWCMRHMDTIAKKGWNQYHSEVIIPNSTNSSKKKN